MKVCIKCYVEKPLNEFGTRYEKPAPYCRLCMTAYNRERYAATRTQTLVRKKEQRDRYQTRLYEVLIERTKDGCAECGELDFRCLQFDHIDQETKEFSICDAWSTKPNFIRLKRELDKCRILCANCHMKHTASQLGWYARYTCNS